MAIALATVAFAGSAFAQSSNEERKDEETPPPPPPTPTPPPSTPPPTTYTPPPTTGIAEPPPAPKKKYDDKEYDEPWVTGTARLADRFYEGGPFMGAGGPLAIAGLASPVQLAGVRVLENHGYLSKFTIAMLMAMGQGNSRYVGSSYHTDSAGNTWRTDYYRPLTPAEREANARAMQAAISAEYVFEMAVYSPSLGLGDKDNRAFAKGFELYLGGQIPLGKAEGVTLPTILQIAFVGSHVSADAFFKPGDVGPIKNSTTEYRSMLYYTNLGVMLRAIVPVTAWLEGYVHWDLNILTLFAKDSNREKGYVWTSPLRGGININVTDRAYVRAHGSLNALSSAGIGYHGEIGIRF
jgi:hypothetical protein